MIKACISGVYSYQGGIYSITNKVNGKVYVGSSIDVGRRKKEHVNGLLSGKHENSHLQNAFNKYGAESFSHEILEYVDNLDTLRDREQHYMDKLQCYKPDNGYNISHTSRGGVINHSDKTKRLLSLDKFGRGNHNYGKKYGDSGSSKGVIQIDMKTKEKIKSWDSQTRAYHSMGYSSVGGEIAHSCKRFKEGFLVPRMSYYWCYSEDYINIDNVIKVNNKKMEQTSVIKLDTLTGEVLETYNTVKDASIKEGISRHGISLTSRGINAHAGGYNWVCLKHR